MISLIELPQILAPSAPLHSLSSELVVALPWQDFAKTILFPEVFSHSLVPSRKITPDSRRVLLVQSQWSFVDQHFKYITAAD